MDASAAQRKELEAKLEELRTRVERERRHVDELAVVVKAQMEACDRRSERLTRLLARWPPPLPRQFRPTNRKSA